jgi:hypothetical protein
MKYVQISVDDDSTSFRPGENLGGTARWQLEESVKSIEIRLFFFTQGKGTSDVEVIESIPIDSPPMSGSQRFDWRLPQSPYSFSGKLISLIWAIEVVLLPSGESETYQFQMTPNGKEIVLGSAS